MLLTINKNPYITLDNYLNIDKMLSLKSEWEFLITSKRQHIRTGVWNAGGHAPEDIYDAPAVHREKGLLYYVYRQADEERKHDSKLDKYLKHFEDTNDKYGLAMFLKLRYQAFDPYHVLNIRKTTGPFYAADAYSFTEDDWEKYYWEDYVDEFPNLKNFILNDLPLDKIGVVTVFYNEHYIPLGYHRDFNYFPFEKGNKPETFPHRQELIWFRFDLERPFYVYDIDEKSGTVNQSIPIQGYSAFFNHHNWHGNFEPYPKSSITVKVEGRFTPEFRKQIGVNNLEYYYYE